MKDHGLKVDTDDILYEKQNGRPSVVGSETTSGAVMTDPDELQRRPGAVDPNRWSGSDLNIIKAR